MPSERVLTRSSLRSWDFAILLVMSLAGLAGSVFLIVQRQYGVAALVTSTALVIAVGTIFAWKRRIQRRQWVLDLGDGWMFIDPAEERRIDDSHALGITFSVIKNYQNGLFVSVTRRLSIWFESPGNEPECARMTNTIRVGTSDPLGNLIHRTSTHLLENARADLAAGRSVHGQEWSINPQMLEVRGKGAASQIPLSDIVAVDEVDGHLCIWRGADEAASVRIPIDSINAWLLGQILAESLPGRDTGN